MRGAAGSTASAGPGSRLTPDERRRLVGAGRRIVPGGVAQRRWPVHRVGHGVRAHRESAAGPVRTTLPACASAPAAAFVRDANAGIPCDRALPAGGQAGARHRRRRRVGVLSVQSRSAAGAAGLARAFHVLVPRSIIRRLDTTRIYREAYESAGVAEGLAGRRRRRARSRRRVRRPHHPAGSADAGDRKR